MVSAFSQMLGSYVLASLLGYPTLLEILYFVLMLTEKVD